MTGSPTVLMAVMSKTAGGFVAKGFFEAKQTLQASSGARGLQQVASATTYEGEK